MLRRRTVSELRYLSPPNLDVARNWSKDFSANLLRRVWQGYDLLCREVLSQIDLSKAEDDLERNITELLEPRIRRCMSSDEPFYIQHGPCERESRRPAPAQPPQYDMAFILNANERFMWPLEAKVLKSYRKKDLAQYALHIRKQFLTCRYAPFSSEAAMLGYLLSKDSDKVFDNIEALVSCKLYHDHKFLNRPHKISDHKRRVPSEKEDEYPDIFRCHHLILQMTKM